ncbi:MAG: PIG-L family deacetylase [Burkholderiales bacterium]|nr:PIG-L family deacetylase [Burkholderiales bacterium]
MESDLFPYQATATLPARHALVLAPHADDEVFGCGGAIAAHVLAGVPVSVVILTNGAAHGDASVRTAESRSAAAVLGCGEPEFWDAPDRALRHDEAMLARLVAKMQDTGADLLYAPSPWEVHPDHRAAASLAAEAARRTGARVAFYEVGSPLRPNVLLDISAHAAAKKQAMQCFASQLAQQDYERQISGLNEYRTYTLPRGTLAAEAYLVLSSAELESALPALLQANPVSAAVASGPAGDAQAPLVSVLVRSVDREHLREALDSVALQTYPNIEVVVIAAKPEHNPLPARCGPFPLRLVTTDEQLPRSRAANKALAEARGQFLLFLDDDDWLMPGHVARLAAVLLKQPLTKAAYAGVALVSPDGTPLGQDTDLPFDGIRQLAGNLMPIHAVLFDKAVVDSGCRFDEALDRFEDWDFWLQVARLTTFAHVPGVSAAYRIHESSGVHDDSGPMGDPTQQIYQKWQSMWSAGQARQMMQRVWATEDLQYRVDLQEAALIQLRGEVDQHIQTVHQLSFTLEQQRVHSEYLERLASAREKAVNDLIASSSWRVTAPLRWLSSKLRR